MPAVENVEVSGNCHDDNARTTQSEHMEKSTITDKSAMEDFNVIIIEDILKVSKALGEKEKYKSKCTTEPEELLDVDDYLLKIGEFGKAQKIIVLLVYLMYIPHCCHSLSMYFTGHSPAWRCSGKTSECNMTGTFDVGDVFYEERCSMSRSSWEYVESKDYSIVTEWDLVCEKKVYPFISNSMLWLGWAIGAMIFGWATDRFGRKRVLFLSWTIMIVSKFCSGISNHFWLYTAWEFIAGFAQGGIALVSSVILSELVGPNYRSMAGAGLGLIHTASVCFLAIEGWLLLNWRQFLMITTAPYLVLLPAYKIIPESFRWLRIKNRLDEAEGILQSLCKMNGKSIPQARLKPAEKSNTNVKKSKSILKYKIVIVAIIVQCVIWFINGQVFFGISMAADQLGGNIFRDFILLNLVGLPAAYVAMVAINKLGRKPTLITVFGATCLSCIAVTLIHPESEYVWGRIGSGMFGTFCMTIAFFGMYVWSLEILPTEIRSKGMGITSLMTRIGACSAPWVAQWLEHVHHTLSFATLGGAAFLAAILCTQLPETRGKPTAETLEDAARKHSKCKEIEKGNGEVIENQFNCV